jgi:hypothetical protein
LRSEFFDFFLLGEVLLPKVSRGYNPLLR